MTTKIPSVVCFVGFYLKLQKICAELHFVTCICFAKL